MKNYPVGKELINNNLPNESNAAHFLGVGVGEHSGSVVESLTHDRRVAGLASPVSLHCVFEQETLILAYYWFNPGRPIPTLLKNC